jgi:hypothetical protein
MNNTNNLRQFPVEKWVDVWWLGPVPTRKAVTVIWLSINFNSDEEIKQTIDVYFILEN